MNKTDKPTANRDSSHLELSPADRPNDVWGRDASIDSDSLNSASANLDSIKLIDAPAWDEVSGEVMFDDRGNAVWEWQTKDHPGTPARREDRDDSILKHIDIDDLRIVESSELQHLGTLSGKLELGQRFSDGHSHKPAKTLFSWLQKENGHAVSGRTDSVAAKPVPNSLSHRSSHDDSLSLASLDVNSSELDPLTRDYLKKHGTPAPSPRSTLRREPQLPAHDPLPVLTTPITREQLTRKAAPVVPTNPVSRVGTSAAKPVAPKTEPAVAPTPAPTLAALLERMGRR